MTFENIGKKAVLLSLLLVISAGALFAGYVAIVLNVSYSKGERVGYVQKFSEKGWLCKTWEGELQMLPVPGAMPEKFLFSVRDESMISKINASMGKRLALSYEQHKGVPTNCFGESEYYAVGAKPLE
jgi:hypothetical protein